MHSVCPRFETTGGRFGTITLLSRFVGDAVQLLSCSYSDAAGLPRPRLSSNYDAHLPIKGCLRFHEALDGVGPLSRGTLIDARKKGCPPKRRAAAMKATPKLGFVEAIPSHALWDGMGILCSD